MILIIIACSLIGSVLLIGVCTPFYATAIPVTPNRDYSSSTVIAEQFRDDRHFNDNGSGDVSDKCIGEDTKRGDFRQWIASRSVPILRSQGKTDEEIKSELLRNFALSKEQVEEILAAQ